MRFARGLFCLISICIFVTPSANWAAQPPVITAWLIDSLIKVFPYDNAGLHKLTAEYIAARNQHISIQIALRSHKPLRAVTAYVTTLRGPAGATIPVDALQRVGYVVVGSHSPDCPPNELVGVAPGWYPDPLLDLPFDLDAAKTNSLWATLYVPADARPGTYRGTVVVRSRARTLAHLPLSVRVVPARVPAERTLQVTNWFSLDNKLSQQFFGVNQFSDNWWKLVANTGHVLAAYRQNVVLTPLMELIQPRVENGHLIYDFSNFDRWVETFRSAGTVGVIEGSHILGRQGAYQAPLVVPGWTVVGSSAQPVTFKPEDPNAQAFLREFLSAIYAHLKVKGWDRIYVQHVLDEAHGDELPFYGKFAEIVHRSMPGVPTVDAVNAKNPMPDELQNNCDVWVPLLGRFDDNLPLLANRIATGHALWYYTCLFPRGRYLNRLMDFPLLKTRLLAWLDFRYGFTGFLHWGGNYWSPDPQLDTQPVINDNTTLLPAGDAFITYPDREHLSLRSSIRLEAMRDGIEDYETLMQLHRLDAGAATRISETAIRSLTEYVRDVSAFRRVERELLWDLSRAQQTAAHQNGSADLPAAVTSR